MLSDQGKDDIKQVEGILIESYRKRNGHYSPWNEMGGSKSGQQVVMENNYNIVRSFCTPNEYYRNPIIARSTIRELSKNPMYAGFENYLHAVRMNILIHGMEYPDALKFTNDFDKFGWYEKIEEAGYNLKKLIV
ncbi:hypothetical protein [Alkaliphilus serpentinus]|uniref:Uncharacterized protein n=1 Tax=Alkaliphilus serpentinus TaxID=1482731 RepID=A0A833HL14_9FIRM|nr:hypothetical protein [Alkaliphilus serpentinus]KAB3524772.1 hypothetical protein F8153_15800 [Alkaliphilus serpentinus]